MNIPNFALRMAIDEYTFDKQQVPRTPRDPWGTHSTRG